MADRKIVIIDSDKDMTEALTQRIKSCGFIVAGINNGAAFFQISSQIMPSLVIMSENLQNPTWSELITRIKHTSLLQKLPFMLFCSQITLGLEQQAKIHGIKQLIQKPFRFTELLNMINEELKEKNKQNN